MVLKNNLFFKMWAITFALFSTFVISQPAKADTINPNGGWQYFEFGELGTSWDKIFSFNLINSGILTITDAFLTGDVFEVLNFGTSLGFTSTPDITQKVFHVGNYDAAVLDSRWSTGIWDLGAGSYEISGIATLSPFGRGGAALRVDTSLVPESNTILLLDNALTGLDALRVDTSPVPEPSTILLLGAALTGLAALRRTRRS